MFFSSSLPSSDQVCHPRIISYLRHQTRLALCHYQIFVALPNLSPLLQKVRRVRAGLTDKHICPSLLRDTFAVRFLQAGGDQEALQEQPGFDDPISVKRYHRLSEQLREEDKHQEPGHPASRRMLKPRISKQCRERPSSGGAQLCE